ncbi:hypothetical protein cypCar_00023604 [Cyprinus carpio]|nr:hypothetical protein cypCar_00023604 [Cyprinus carpio]
MGVENPEYSDADFTYDYELIRRGGLIFAAVLFCLGMAIIFSLKTMVIFDFSFINLHCEHAYALAYTFGKHIPSKHYIMF